MREHRLPVTRSARYYTLGAVGLGEVWFVLHGYGQLAARFLKQFQPLDDGRRLIVAPEGLSRFYVDSEAREKVGAAWMTREDRLADIDDYVRYLNAVHADLGAGGDAALHVLGFSQGAATACRWAAFGTARPTRLILWGGEVPPDLDLVTLRGIPLTIVYGRRDAMITAKIVAATEVRLQEHALDYRLVPFDGGHELDSAVLERLARP